MCPLSRLLQPEEASGRDAVRWGAAAGRVEVQVGWGAAAGGAGEMGGHCEGSQALVADEGSGGLWMRRTASPDLP